MATNVSSGSWMEQRGAINVAPGETIDFSGSVQTEFFGEGLQDYAVIHLYLKGSDNAIVGNIYSGNIQTDNLTWEQFLVSIVVPEGAVDWVAQINGFRNSGGNVNVYFDDLLLSQGTAMVPVPAAIWLFGSALSIIGWIRLTGSGKGCMTTHQLGT